MPPPGSSAHAGRGDRRADTPHAENGGGTPRRGLFLGAFLFLTIAYFIPGASWNPMSRFALTRAVVELGGFEITPFADMTGDKAKVGDRTFSDKAPIPSLLAVPPYALYYAYVRARHRAPSFQALGPPDSRADRVVVDSVMRMGLYVASVTTAGLAGAMLGVALFELLRRRLSQRVAMAGALATLLGTPLYAYATSFFGHTLAAAFLFGAFALVECASREQRARQQALAGACLALAIGCEYITAFPALVLTGYFVWREEQPRRAVLWLAAGAFVPLAAIAIYHHVCFGAPWRTGYGFITLPVFAAGHAQGFYGLSYPKLDALLGLTVGRSRGLFYVAPISAVGVVASIWAWQRRQDRQSAVALLVFCALLVANASYYLWDGGRALGPRHLVPALGFLGLGIGYALDSRKWRPVAAALAIGSALVMVAMVAVAIEVPPRADAIFGYLLPALESGRIARVPGASNLGLALGLSRGWSLVPLVAWVCLGVFWLTRPDTGREHDGAKTAQEID